MGRQVYHPHSRAALKMIELSFKTVVRVLAVLTLLHTVLGRADSGVGGKEHLAKGVARSPLLTDPSCAAA